MEATHDLHLTNRFCNQSLRIWRTRIFIAEDLIVFHVLSSAERVLEVFMWRKFTLDFGTDAKHKLGFIWHKNSLRPTSWYSEDYQVLSRFGLGNDEKGGRSRAKPWSISKSLVVFQCQVYTPIPQASRVSLNSKDCATQSVEFAENRSLMWITSRLAWSSKNVSRLHQRNKPIYRIVKAGLILNRNSRTRYRSVTTSKTKAIRKAGIWLTCYSEKS